LSTLKPFATTSTSKPSIVTFASKHASKLVNQICHTSTTKKKNEIVKVQDSSKKDGQCIFLGQVYSRWYK
jgi:hypothetical protein